MSTFEKFPSWLKRRRRALDLSREGLAQQAHCSASTIRRLEAGDLRPSTQLAELLASVLHLPPEETERFTLFARGHSHTPPIADLYSPANSPASLTAPNPDPGKLPVLSKLPAPLTSFVGRKEEVTAVCQLLQEPSVRLLNLTGPPGTGKTRLSLAAAAQLNERGVFSHGIYFVPLAPITDPEMVLVTIAQTMEVTEPQHAGEGLAPLQQALHAYLQTRHLLLLLDNFEQVTSAAPLITELLAAAPGLKVLVTSREVLHVYGENEFPVPPLPLPDVHHLPTGTAVSSLSRFPSLRLFQERARAAKPDFRLTVDNVADVARICAWLDGLPLAIEMAAAQVKWLTPNQVFAQLQTRLVSLTGGPRDLTPRQQSLSGAIAWSYHLLNESERQLFNMLGIFMATYEETAVATIWQTLTGRNEPQAISLLHSLVEKSLLRHQVTPAGQARYAMLETLREYALEQLKEAGQETAVRQAHAHYYAGLAQKAYQEIIVSNNTIDWLETLEQENHNMRAALTWTLATAKQTQDPSHLHFAQEFVESLQPFWYMRGYLHEGRHWLDWALALSLEADLQQARLLNRVGQFARLQGDLALAQNCHERALIVQQQQGDELGECRSLENLAILAGTQGDYHQARTLLEQTLAINRHSNNSQRSIISTLNNLAIVLRRLGDLAGAEQLYLEGTQICRETNNLNSLSFALHGLGELQLQQGNAQTGLAYLQKSLDLRHQVRNQPEIAISLNAIGLARLQLGDALGAVRLFATSERLHEELGMIPVASYQAEFEAKIQPARELLGESNFSQTWQEGRALSLDEAVRRAMAKR